MKDKKELLSGILLQGTAAFSLICLPDLAGSCWRDTVAWNYWARARHLTRQSLTLLDPIPESRLHLRRLLLTKDK